MMLVLNCVEIPDVVFLVLLISARVERRQRGRSESAEAEPRNRDRPGQRELEGGP